MKANKEYRKPEVIRTEKALVGKKNCCGGVGNACKPNNQYSGSR